MRHLLIVAAILAAIPVTLVTTSTEVSARRIIDYPNYGYCPGSLRRVANVHRCRAPGPYSGQCPAGTYTKWGRSWAWDVRNCRATRAI